MSYFKNRSGVSRYTTEANDFSLITLFGISMKCVKNIIKNMSLVRIKRKTQKPLKKAISESYKAGASDET